MKKLLSFLLIFNVYLNAFTFDECTCGDGYVQYKIASSSQHNLFTSQTSSTERCTSKSSSGFETQVWNYVGIEQDSYNRDRFAYDIVESTYTCEVSGYTCSDGAPMLTNSSGISTCDRTCESVGYETLSASTCQEIIPVDNCSQYADECSTQCSATSVENFACSNNVITSNCSCSAETPPPDVVPPSDSIDLTNLENTMSSFKSENDTNTKDIANKLDTTNTSLNSLNTALSEKLDTTNTSLDSLNTALSEKLDTSNTSLNALNTALSEKLDASSLKSDTTNGNLDNISGLLTDSNLKSDTTNGNLDNISGLLNDSNLKSDTTNGNLDNISGLLNDGFNGMNGNLLDIKNSINSSAIVSVDNPIDSSILDTLASEYTTFYDSMNNNFDNISTLGTTATDTISSGFTFNLSASSITTCPTSFVLDLSSIGQANNNFTFDVCYITSQMRPITYPLFYALFSLSMLFYTFRMIRSF